MSNEPPWGRGGAAKNADWQMVSPIVFSCAARKNRWESSRARRPNGNRKGLAVVVFLVITPLRMMIYIGVATMAGRIPAAFSIHVLKTAV